MAGIGGAGLDRGMKSIIYAHTELLTGDAIAVAVLHYSAALADNGLAETIEIPVVEPDGSRTTALMLVGPASQIVAKGVHTGLDELVDDEVVAELARRTRMLRPEGMADLGDPDDLEWQSRS
ncbi:hypothetical protein ACPW96_22210 [Micromonospora sp. DT81.3]|uniref:hypothetical protein n=1 Tax=Micromonospora sp. DT81.3 TaxID=3416523 RepID=UPI003CE8A441